MSNVPVSDPPVHQSELTRRAPLPQQEEDPGVRRARVPTRVVRSCSLARRIHHLLAPLRDPPRVVLVRRLDARTGDLHGPSFRSLRVWAGRAELIGVTSRVLQFGFVQLIPQLIINYKLKSVAHMPMKAMVYKSKHR